MDFNSFKLIKVVNSILYRTVAALGLIQGEIIIFVSSMLLSPLMVCR